MYALIDASGKYLSTTNNDGKLTVLTFQSQEDAESFRELFGQIYENCRVIVYAD